MFFKHFASKNQLPGFYIIGKLVENRLNENATKQKYLTSFLFSTSSTLFTVGIMSFNFFLSHGPTGDVTGI